MTITIFGTTKDNIYESSFNGDVMNIIKYFDTYIENAKRILDKEGAKPYMYIVWEKKDFGKIEDLTPEIIKQYE